MGTKFTGYTGKKILGFGWIIQYLYTEEKGLEWKLNPALIYQC
jgi:lipid-A-disaccharide synthase-like uncharacterized protein